MSDWSKYNKFFQKSSYVIPFEPLVAIAKHNKIYTFKENKIIEAPLIGDVFSDVKMFWLASGVEEQIHEINLDDELFIEFIYAERLRVNNYNKIKVIGYNEKDEEVFSLKQLNKTERLFVGRKDCLLDLKMKNL